MFQNYSKQIFFSSDYYFPVALEASRPRQKARSKGHPPSSETTPLISGSKPEDKTGDGCCNCCTLL